MLNIWQLWLVVLGVLVSSFPLGYLLLNFRRGSTFSELKLSMVPVFATLGLAGLTTVLYALSFWSLSLLVIVPLVAAFWILFFVQRLRMGWRPGQTIAAVRSVLSRRPPLNLVGFGLVTGFAILALSVLLGKRGVTPPPGDPVTHGTHVALLLYNGGFHLSGIPLWDEFASVTTFYPKGLHVLGAATSLMTGLYPIESVLVLGATVAFLLPLLVYSFIHLKTAHAGLATVGALIIFLVPAARFTVFQYNLYAYFVQGVYPFLYGLTLFVAFLILLSSKNERDRTKAPPELVVGLSVLGVTLLLSYYFFAVVVAIFVVGRLSVLLLGMGRKAWIGIAVAAGLVGLYVAFALILRSSAVAFVRLNSPSDLGVFWLPLAEFLTSPFALLVIPAIFVVIIGLVQRRHLGIAIGFLIFAALLLVSMLDRSLYLDYLWFLAPRRSIVALILLSSVVLLVYVWDFAHIAKRSTAVKVGPGEPRRKISGLNPIFISAIAGLLIFNGAVYFNAQIAVWGFPQGEDYSAIIWILDNVDTEDLILNDRSFFGLYLPAFGIKNVIHLRELQYSPNSEAPYAFPSFMLQRIHESAVVFDDPGNLALVHSVIEKWQIKYVFVGSDNLYYDYWQDGRYERREHSTLSLLRSLDENPDLTPVFRLESVGVYSTFLVASSLTPPSDSAERALPDLSTFLSLPQGAHVRRTGPE